MHRRDGSKANIVLARKFPVVIHQLLTSRLGLSDFPNFILAP